MKKAVKGLILLPISILISVNQGINKNFDVSKTSFINALTVSPLKKGIEKAKGFKVILTEKKPKEDFVSSFDYYKIHETISPIVLADVLNKNVFDSEIVEIKLILNPKDYDFDEYNDVISKSTPVLETIKRDGNEGLIKSFYVPTTQEIEAIKSKAKDISPKEEIYPSLITSLTMEASYKSSLPRITSRYSVAKSNQVDNQAALDHYLETFNQQVDVLGLGFGKSEQTENIFTTDDSIINLIPKNCFTTNGKFSHGGAEWGYFVDTYNDNSRGKMSSIFIYDIYNLKTDLLNPETIQIKPILSYNYKYDMEMNVVYKDGPNNYCMGNPSFKSAITYANIPGSTNTKKFLNYGESGYSQLNDNGFCIGSNSVKYVGVGKTYDKKIEDVEKIALFLGGIALSAATSGMSLGASVAIGAAYDLIGDALIEKLNSEIKEVNLNTINNSEKYEKSITNIVGYSSYEYAR